MAILGAQNINQCYTLGSQAKYVYKKVYGRYCKAVHGLNKLACNISSLCELDNLPGFFFSVIKTQVMMDFVRLNSQKYEPFD